MAQLLLHRCEPRDLAILLLWPLALCAQTAKLEEFSAIEGRVIDSVTGRPVGKAALLLMRTDSAQSRDNWTRSYSASSDSTGKFAIQNIEPGQYRLRASRNGFLTTEYGAHKSRPSGTVLDLERPQQLKDVVLPLTPHGVITGRVLDADSDPLDGAQVQLLQSLYVNVKKVLSTTHTGYTNDLGEYRFPNLVAGRYWIYAEDFKGLAPSSAAQEDYVPVYYPGATDAVGAIPLSVTAGAEVRADMMLRKARTATVKGKVLVSLPGAVGIPMVLVGRQVGHDNRPASTFRTLGARVNAAGEFEIRNLTPGTYRITPQVSRQGRGYYSEITVDVAGTDIEGLVVTIDSGVSLAGVIRVDGERAQDLHKAKLRLLHGGVEALYEFKMAEDGSFTIENLRPNRYEIAVTGLPDGFYVKSVRAGDADVTYSGLDVTGGAPGHVDILVSAKAGLISGVAQNPNNNRPAPGATVVLVPKEKERREISTLYQQATTDQYGRFRFKNVVPGEYKVYAWEDVQSTAWMDPDFIKPVEDKGEPVSVGESTETNVQVKLILADLDQEKLR